MTIDATPAAVPADAIVPGPGAPGYDGGTEAEVVAPAHVEDPAVVPVIGPLASPVAPVAPVAPVVESH